MTGICSTLVRRLCPRLAVLGAAWLIAAPAAQAQERVHTALIPDLELVQPLMPASGRASDFDDGPRFLWDLTGAAGQSPGALRAVALGHARLRWGARLSRSRWLAVRSDLAIEDTGPDAPTGMIAGRHTLAARFGLGELEAGMGVDLALDGELEHLGHGRRALEHPALGPGALLRTRVVATSEPRINQRSPGSDADGFAFPMSAGVHRVEYLSRHTPVTRAATESLGLGVGARMIDRHAVELGLELLGVRREQTVYTVAPARPGEPTSGRLAAEQRAAAVPEEVTQTSLYMAKLDMALFEDDVAIAASGHTGWTWLRDTTGRRRVNLWTMNYGFHLRGEGVGTGLAFGRNGTPSADGTRFLAEYRIEALFELVQDEYGGELRAVAGWLTDQENESRERDPGVLGRYGGSAEVYHCLGHHLGHGLGCGLQVGAYSTARYQPAITPRAWDAWRAPRGWTGEVGAFLRWRSERGSLTGGL